ncbi:MAG: hypothetical protein EXS10_01825 [Phycisphaerales bacterium]|nr:hypothetical protein [Phycisphaerales bacterium]
MTATTFASPLLASTEIWIPLAGLLVATVIGFLIAMRLRANSKTVDAADGFTLHDLRQLHKEGKLSAEELASATALLKERVRREAQPVEPDAGTPASGKKSPRTGRSGR